MHHLTRQARAITIDGTIITKQANAVQTLAQLKYVQDDIPVRLLKTFYNCLKTGVAFTTAITKYEATADSTQARLAKDPENKFLIRVGVCLQGYLDACQSMEQLSAEGHGSDCALLGLHPRSVFGIFGENGGQSNVFFDSVGIRSTAMKGHLDRAVASLQQLCGGLACGEHHWRKDCGADASLQDLKASSKVSLKKLDGSGLKTALQSLAKARHTLTPESTLVCDFLV